MAQIDSRKIALLHVAQKRVGIDDDDAWRALLRRIAGVESSRDLDQPGFEAVMDELRRLGFESDFHKANLGSREGMASPAQIALMRRLWGEYTAGQGTDASLGKWLDRQFKVSALRFVPDYLAPKAITALKAMVAKAEAKRKASA